MIRIYSGHNIFFALKFGMAVVFILFVSPVDAASTNDAQAELELLLQEVELDGIEVEDVESNQDLRGRRYVRDARKLEAEIAADREIRNRSKRILRFRVPRTNSISDFDQLVSRIKSVGIENVRPQNRVGVRRRQREFMEEKLASRRPIRVKEFIAIEAEDILRSLRKAKYFSSKFSVNHPRNPSASAFTSSATESNSQEIETESIRIMRALFRSGSHETHLHPGADIRRSSAER